MADPQQHNDNIKPTPGDMSGMSVEMINARGENTVRTILMVVMGLVDLVLAIGSIAIAYKDTEKAKDIFVITGPIISGTLLGTIGYIFGQSKGKK